MVYFLTFSSGHATIPMSTSWNGILQIPQKYIQIQLHILCKPFTPERWNTKQIYELVLSIKKPKCSRQHILSIEDKREFKNPPLGFLLYLSHVMRWGILLSKNYHPHSAYCIYRSKCIYFLFLETKIFYFFYIFLDWNFKVTSIKVWHMFLET